MFNTEKPLAFSFSVLLRCGLFLLIVVCPAVGFFSSDLLLVGVPISVLFIWFAAIFEDGAAFGERLKQLVTRRTFFILTLLVTWETISIAWAPFGSQNALMNFVIFIAALFTLASLPERMRVTNAYLVLIAEVIFILELYGAILATYFYAMPPEISQRAALGAIFLLFPAMLILFIRGYYIYARVLFFIVATPVVALGAEYSFILGVGALSYLGCRTTARLCSVVLNVLIPSVIMSIPALLLIALAARRLGVDFGLYLSAWSKVIALNPLRLFIGYGRETAAHVGKEYGAFLEKPAGFIFDSWVDLGLIGALIIACIFTSVITAVGRASTTAAAVALAATTSVLASAFMSASAERFWWLNMILIMTTAFLSIGRSRKSERRPSAHALFPDVDEALRASSSSR